jgi:hypothetical protein
LRARRYHILVLLLPHKRHTFDYCHPVTALAHLVDDFKAEMGEDDLTHLPEILVLRDLERDPDGGDMASFKARSLRNVENRCLHHHVFDTRLADDLLSHASFKVWAVEEIAPHHILHPRGNRRRFECVKQVNRESTTAKRGIFWLKICRICVLPPPTLHGGWP